MPHTIPHAAVVELVDTLVSEASGRKAVLVQIRSAAPLFFQCEYLLNKDELLKVS